MFLHCWSQAGSAGGGANDSTLMSDSETEDPESNVMQHGEIMHAEITQQQVSNAIDDGDC
jgi:hypothetical protein